MIDPRVLKTKTLAFIEKQHLSDQGVGRYRYSPTTEKQTLYSSTYAAMTRSLYGDLSKLTFAERQEWIDYLNRHQDEDGLFSDPVIYDQGWYKGDPFWCGGAHLTCHVLTALRCLGAVANRPFSLVKQFYGSGKMLHWLESRDWEKQVDFVGNEVMNLGVLLQYARDFHDDRQAGDAVELMIDWLNHHWLQSDWGVWGTLDNTIAQDRSRSIQAAYHWWLLYFYDQQEVPFVERAIDTLLDTANDFGGFGWGVHNAITPNQHSSACEDIDSIDPLVRLSLVTAYRSDDIGRVLAKAADWVVQNQEDDGGFVFIKNQPFEYGHPQLRGEKGDGAMFPTWFRTLSLALLAQRLGKHPLAEIDWQFIDCPGLQFWR